MAATRLVGTSKTSTRHSTSPCSSFSSAKTVRCVINAAGFNEESKRVCGSGDQRKPAVPLKASVATSDSLMITTKTKPELDRGMGIDKLASLFLKVTDAFLNNVLSAAVKQTPWKFQVQRFIERAIIDCRFFTLFAVGGSLLGSILCFAEGCFLVLESYFKFFYTLSQKPDQAHIMHLVIEAIDMFLVGTALLIFGIGLYAMFVGSKNRREEYPKLIGSNLFGFFYLKTLPKWVEMESVSQAKSRIGHAVMMMLQVGVLEKFNSIPIVTSLDLVCFAGAVLLSSCCIFLLSGVSAGNTK